MQTMMRMIGLVAALALLVPLLAAQEKSKNKTEKKDNPAKLPKIRGTIVNPGSDKGGITLKISFPEPYRSGKKIQYREGHKNVELTQADEVIVRTAAPPIFYDNGKPRKPTAKELKEAKGDTSLPGYQSELGNLKANQVVDCYCILPKKTTGKKDDADALVDNKPKVRMIVILKEP